MSDLWSVALALAAASGALHPRPVPVLLAAALAGAGRAARAPLLLCLGIALAASGLAHRSWSGLRPPVEGPWSGVATLATDPAEVAGVLRVDLRIAGKRVEAWARGGPAGRLRARLAGEQVWVAGTIRAVPADARARLAPRHVAARMTVGTVGESGPGRVLARAANRVRRTLAAGSTSLPPERRALFSGFVLGDSRGQPPEVVHDFRASGLAHLLVVSGQNVAFVLALAGPALRRLGLRARLVAGLGVLVVFGTLTRWEPSVLRAAGMTAVGLLAGTLGRPASAIRLLALAVTGLLLVDPLLVGSLGFRLSVGASAGLALLARPLTAALPGPRPVAAAAAVTLAAQAGVAPFLVPAFGGLPSASLAANLAAAPAAGPLMVWGLAAGIPAGLVHPELARVLHLPTGALVAWVAGVARTTAGLPLGRLGLGSVLALGLAAAAAVTARRAGRAGLARAALLAAAAVVVAPAVAATRPPPADGLEVARGVALWRSGPATVVVLDGGRTSPDRALDGLRAAGVRRVDLLVARRGGRAEATLALAVGRRLPVRLLLAPDDARMGAAIEPAPGTVLAVGDLTVEVGRDDRGLTVTIERRRGPPA